mmetsp:Transcript_19278/g.24320  ORF Transcript_19278/g.24320 Transcript_19278/m.24320 type:complete len:560 (+) Transcript_19278:24-1703(+)
MFNHPHQKRAMMKFVVILNFLYILFQPCNSFLQQNSFSVASKKLSSQQKGKVSCSMSLSSASPMIDAVNSVKSKELSAAQLMKETLLKIDETDPHVGAFLSVFGEEALKKATDIDEAIASGDTSILNKPLLGLPIAIKDNICTAGKPTTAASKVLEGYIPSYSAEVVSRLEEAGAIVVGKVNMDEFAMGSTTETSAFRVTRNPRALDRVPGGSSGGSAAAVASGAVLASLGTDTGGSIRQPSSFCGVVGLKPSYGRVSRSGLLAYASSTDCIGPIANTVKDCAQILQVIAGSDTQKDASSLDAPVPDYLCSLVDSDETPLKGLRIGVLEETQNCDPEVLEALKKSVDTLAALGAEIKSVSLPQLPQQCAAYYVNVLSEASANLARYDGIRYGSASKQQSTARGTMLNVRGGFGDEVKSRILIGTFSLSAGYSDAYYKKALDIRTLLSEEFSAAFEEIDAFVCPTNPVTPYKIGKSSEMGVQVYQDDLFTVPANLAGLPALSVPCDVSTDGLPIGLQIIGNTLKEDLILQVGYHFEQATKLYEKLENQIPDSKTDSCVVV